MDPAYVTREHVQRALGLADTVRLTMRVDSAIQAATENLNSLTHRKFYPTLATRGFDVPSTSTLWLYDHELTGTPTSITSGSTVMTAADYILGPLSGPPYRWIDVNTSGSTAWQAGDTSQRSISIVGSFGASSASETVATLDGGITSSALTLDVVLPDGIGVGDLIRIDDERMVVSNRTFVASGATVTPTLTASKAEVSIAVSNGALIGDGDWIQVDSERMFVTSVVGNTLTVVRGEQGSVLATHAAGASVAAPRRLTVSRAAVGTTAASHLTAASVSRNVPPSLIVEGALALAEDLVQQASAGYAVSLGSGTRRTDSGSQRDAPGGALPDLMERIYGAHGRKSRSRAVM